MNRRKVSRNGYPAKQTEDWEKWATVQDIKAEYSANRSDYDRDPEFLTGFLKLQFASDVYAAMEARKLNKRSLATLLGKSRQYVGKVLNENANFTIESMAEIACALGYNLTIRLSAENEKALSGKQRGKPKVAKASPRRAARKGVSAASRVSVSARASKKTG